MLGMILCNIEDHKCPSGVAGATGTVVYQVSAEKYAATKRELETETPRCMKAIGFYMSQLSLLWAAEFLTLYGCEESEHVISELNCFCIGTTGFLGARGKNFLYARRPISKGGGRACATISEL